MKNLKLLLTSVALMAAAGLHAGVGEAAISGTVVVPGGVLQMPVEGASVLYESSGEGPAEPDISETTTTDSEGNFSWAQVPINFVLGSTGYYSEIKLTVTYDDNKGASWSAVIDTLVYMTRVIKGGGDAPPDTIWQAKLDKTIILEPDEGTFLAPVTSLQAPGNPVFMLYDLQGRKVFEGTNEELMKRKTQLTENRKLVEPAR